MVNCLETLQFISFAGNMEQLSHHGHLVPSQFCLFADNSDLSFFSGLECFIPEKVISVALPALKGFEEEEQQLTNGTRLSPLDFLWTWRKATVFSFFFSFKLFKQDIFKVFSHF